MVVGLPYLGPYNVNSILNPILVHCLGLGYLFNMYRNKPVVRPGGAMIMFHPVPREFHQVHHPSLRRLLRGGPGRDDRPVDDRVEVRGAYATDPWYIHLYRKSYAYHGVHPFYMWYWGAHALRLPGRRDLRRRRTEDVRAARATARPTSFRDALEMARETVGRSPVDHVLPRAAAHDRGRAVMARWPRSSRDEIRDVAKGWRWGRRPMMPRSRRSPTPPPSDLDVPDRLGPHRGRHAPPAT